MVDKYHKVSNLALKWWTNITKCHIKIVDKYHKVSNLALK